MARVRHDMGMSLCRTGHYIRLDTVCGRMPCRVGHCVEYKMGQVTAWAGCCIGQDATQSSTPCQAARGRSQDTTQGGMLV